MIDELQRAFKRLALLRPGAVAVGRTDEHGRAKVGPHLHTLGGAAVILVVRRDGQRAGVALPGSGLHFCSPVLRHGPKMTPEFAKDVINARELASPRPSDMLMVWVDTDAPLALQGSPTTAVADFVGYLAKRLPPTFAAAAGAQKRADAVHRDLCGRVWSLELLARVLVGHTATVAVHGDRVRLRGVNLNLPLSRALLARARETGTVLRRGELDCSVESIARAAKPALADFLVLWIAGTTRRDLLGRAPIRRRLSGTEHAGPAARVGGSAGSHTATPRVVADAVAGLAGQLRLVPHRSLALAARVEATFRRDAVYPSFACQSERRDVGSRGTGAMCMQCPYAPASRHAVCGHLGSTPVEVAVTLLALVTQSRGHPPPLLDVLPACVTAPPGGNANNVWREEVSRVFRGLYEARAAADRS